MYRRMARYTTCSHGAVLHICKTLILAILTNVVGQYQKLVRTVISLLAITCYILMKLAVIIIVGLLDLWVALHIVLNYRPTASLECDYKSFSCFMAVTWLLINDAHIHYYPTWVLSDQSYWVIPISQDLTIWLLKCGCSEQSNIKQLMFDALRYCSKIILQIS